MLSWGNSKQQELHQKGSKCKSFRKEVKYLGYIMSKGKVKPDPEKVNAILKYGIPETLKQPRSFLGLANIGGQFIKHFATIASSLTDLLQEEKERSQKGIGWSPEAESAFHKIKQSVADTTARNQMEKERPFILTTDVSHIAMGAILS
jgi:hypothetical protein